jgi:hypothetical protein
VIIKFKDSANDSSDANHISDNKQSHKEHDDNDIIKSRIEPISDSSLPMHHLGFPVHNEKRNLSKSVEVHPDKANDLIEQIAGKLLTLSGSKSPESSPQISPRSSSELKSHSAHSSSTNLNKINQTNNNKNPSSTINKTKETKKQRPISHHSDYSHVKSRINSGRQVQEKPSSSSNIADSEKTQSIKIPNVDDKLVSFILDEIVDNGQKLKFSDIGQFNFSHTRKWILCVLIKCFAY